MSTFTPLGNTASKRNASQQADNPFPLGSNISQNVQIASLKRSKISNSGITKESSYSIKKSIPPSYSVNELNHQFGLDLANKKLSGNQLQGEAI